MSMMPMGFNPTDPTSFMRPTPTPQPAPTPVRPSPASHPPTPAYNPTPVPTFNMPGINQPPQQWKAPFELGDLKDLLSQAMSVTPPKEQAQPQARDGLSAQQQYGGTNYTPLAYNPGQSTFIPGAMRERGNMGLRMGGYF